MTNSNYLITVIIPVYNVEKYVKQCIDSVVLQTKRRDIEIIIVDDGSTDNSSEICDCYAGDNIKIIHKPNGGLSDARNWGLEIATGKYVVFLDSDDYWDDHFFLEKIEEKIKITEPDIIVFGYKKLFENETTSLYIPRGMADSVIQLMNDEDYNICAWDKVIKRDILANNRIEFRKGVCSEDMEWCALVFAHVTTCSVLRESSYVYRQRRESISKNITFKNVDDIIKNFSTCLKIKDYLSEEKKNVYGKYLAKNLSLMIIAMSTCSDESDISYDVLVKKNIEYLRDGRIREKIIYLSIKLLGIKNTKYLLRKYMRIKSK